MGQLMTPHLIEPGVTVGSAIAAAKQELAGVEGGSAMTDVLYGWTLLGDPALIIDPNVGK
jgi:hypothetical protein